LTPGAPGLRAAAQVHHGSDPLQLGPARRTGEKAGRDDYQQQRCHIQCFVDALLPVLPPGDIGPVLEDHEFPAGLRQLDVWNTGLR
jgi:hypothetical protein